MEKETIVYDVLEASDIALTCRQIFENGAKEFYSMEELSRLLYELRQQGLIQHGRKVDNKHTYLIPYELNTKVILGDKPMVNKTNMSVEHVKTELQAIKFCDYQGNQDELAELLNAIKAGLPFLKDRMPIYSSYLNKAITILEGMQ